MKTKEIIRLVIWGLLFICAFTCAVIGFINSRYNNSTQINGQYIEII